MRLGGFKVLNFFMLFLHQVRQGAQSAGQFLNLIQLLLRDEWGGQCVDERLHCIHPVGVPLAERNQLRPTQLAVWVGDLEEEVPPSFSTKGDDGNCDPLCLSHDASSDPLAQ